MTKKAAGKEEETESVTHQRGLHVSSDHLHGTGAVFQFRLSEITIDGTLLSWDY